MIIPLLERGGVSFSAWQNLFALISDLEHLGPVAVSFCMNTVNQ